MVQSTEEKNQLPEDQSPENQQKARNLFGNFFKECPKCKSKNIEYSMDIYRAKPKPCASCGDCGELIAYG